MHSMPWPLSALRSEQLDWSLACTAAVDPQTLSSRRHRKSRTEPPQAIASVTLRVDANAPKAQVLVRRRTSAVPALLEVTPTAVEELVAISAPNRKTIRYWLTFDRSIQVRAQLPKSRGVVEATPAETLAALHPVDEAY